MQEVIPDTKVSPSHQYCQVNPHLHSSRPATAEVTSAGNSSKKSRRRRGGRGKKKMADNTESTPGAKATGAAAPVAEVAGESTGDEMEDTKSLVEEAKELANKVQGAEGGAEGGEGLSEETKAKIEEVRERALVAINKLRGTQEGLSQYQGELQEWIDDQIMLENQMMEALENTRRMRARIRDEQERIAALREQFEVMEPEQDGDGRRV